MKNTIFHNLRPSFLIIPCKPNCTLRISTNQVKMIGKPLKLTARHSKWEKGTFYRCNRTKQVVDLELENLNLDQSFWNGSPWNEVKNTILQTFRPYFLIIPCKLNSTLRISINYVKMIGKPLKLTVRHAKWERGTFYKRNRTNQAVDFEFKNLNLDKSI